MTRKPTSLEHAHVSGQKHPALSKKSPEDFVCSKERPFDPEKAHDEIRCVWHDSEEVNLPDERTRGKLATSFVCRWCGMDFGVQITLADYRAMWRRAERKGKLMPYARARRDSVAHLPDETTLDAYIAFCRRNRIVKNGVLVSRA